MRKRILGFIGVAALLATPIVAEEGRSATIALWGGYTPYVGAVDSSGYDNACSVYTKVGGSCTNKFGGFAGGADLWIGHVVQLGFAAQYFMAANLDGSSSTSVTTGVGPLATTTTVKTTEKLVSQFIPLMAQLRIHPKYFYIGIGAGTAINITSYEYSVNGASVSGRKTSNPTGFFAQATLGVSLPLAAEVSIDAFVKASLLTVFYNASTDSSGTTTYSSASAYAITPGLAVAFHF